MPFVSGERCALISRELLDILACPVCRVAVKLEEERLLCEECGRKYPIVDGIPVMLVEEAELPEGAEPDEEVIL